MRIAIALLVLFAVPASSETAEDAAATRWLPGVALEIGVRSINVNSSVSSIRGDIDSDTRSLYGYVGASVQIATPVLLPNRPWAGSPRLFLRIGVGNAFSGDELVSNEGGIDQLTFPPVPDADGDGQPDFQVPPTAIFGQGSATAVESKSFIGNAGIGVDFTVEALDRRFHLRPSFEWIVQQQQVKALLSFAGVSPSSPTPERCPCRLAEVRGEEAEYFHGIGVGFEGSVEAGRFGPFMTNVFLATQAYYELDRKLTVVATGPFLDGSGFTSVRSTYESDRWDYRVGMGIRFDWLPE